MKILYIQPWGIGDLVLSFKALANTSIEISDVDFIVAGTAQAELVQILSPNSKVMNFGQSRIFRFVNIISKCARVKKEYTHIIIATRINILYFLILKLLCRRIKIYGDVKNFKLSKIFPQNLRYTHNGENRVLSNIRMIKDIKETPNKKNTYFFNRDNKFDKGDSIEIGFFVGHSDAGKGVGAEFASEVIEELRKTNAKIKGIFITNNNSYISKQEYIDVIDTITIGDLISRIRKMSAFVAGDVGPLHIASLVDIPLVTVAGPTDWNESAPSESQIIIAQGIHKCRPCYHTNLYGNCPFDMQCMTTIDSKLVADALKNMMISGFSNQRQITFSSTNIN